MKLTAALAMSLAIAGCVSEAAEEEFEFGQGLPTQSGKSDGPSACGTDSCEPTLCGYDCSVAGEQATKSCAESDGRESTFVTGSANGSTFDSRTNPFAPVYSLNNVLVYGCDLWDFSSGEYDGLEVRFEELIHSSFTVNPDDPTRFGKNFGLYIDHFAGPGSYRAEASYQASNEAARYGAGDACTVDVAVDAAGTVSGSYDCSIAAQAGGSGSVAVKGTFGCAKNSMDPIFSAWAASPN
jgi:hypothetical protein